MSFAIYGNYIRAWDENPTITTIGPFFEKWRLVVELLTDPYDGGIRCTSGHCVHLPR